MLADFQRLLERKRYGVPVTQICREERISKQTFYNWRKKYVRLSFERLKQEREMERSLLNLCSILRDLTLHRRGTSNDGR